MKILKVILLLWFTLFTIASTRAQNSNTKAQNAIKILQSTEAMITPMALWGNTDCDELYEKQLTAINVLGAAKIRGTVPVLIPYLDYATKGQWGLIKVHPQADEDIHKTRSLWPAFSAVIDVPDASRALSTYALNKENPIKFRMACYNALRYTDIQKCKADGEKLLKEFHTSNQKLYIEAVMRGRVSFEGIVGVPF